MRRGGVLRQILEHGLALATALLAVGFVEKDLGARLVQVIAEIEAPGNPAGQTPLAAADRPSRDDLRKAGDIRLRVATVHTQGVQFKNFARQVFVDAELALAPGGELRQLGVLAHRRLVVEEGDHGRVLFHRDQ